jgi:hypothetical protein
VGERGAANSWQRKNPPNPQQQLLGEVILRWLLRLNETAARPRLGL